MSVQEVAKRNAAKRKPGVVKPLNFMTAAYQAQEGSAEEDKPAPLEPEGDMQFTVDGEGDWSFACDLTTDVETHLGRPGSAELMASCVFPMPPEKPLRMDLDSSSDSDDEITLPSPPPSARPLTGIEGKLQFSSLIRGRTRGDRERLDRSGAEELVIAPLPPPLAAIERPPPPTAPISGPASLSPRGRGRRWQPRLQIAAPIPEEAPTPTPRSSQMLEQLQLKKQEIFGDSSDDEVDPAEVARTSSACGRHEFLLSCQDQQVLPVAVLNMNEDNYENRNLLHSRTLQSRSWAGYNLGQEVVLALSKAMRHGTTTSQIQVLDLSKNGIRAESARELIQVLTDQCAKLVDLNLAYNELGTEAGVAIANMLQHVTSLTKLNLSNNKLGDTVCSTLAEGLKFSLSLSDLNLASNNIQITGAQSLGDALDNNVQLLRLDLSYNNIWRQGAVAIAKSLAFNATLTWLDLSWNGFSEMGGEEIGHSLETSRGIRHLCLSHNRIGPRASQVPFVQVCMNVS